jgi:hypothetical protein
MPWFQSLESAMAVHPVLMRQCAGDLPNTG